MSLPGNFARRLKKAGFAAGGSAPYSPLTANDLDNRFNTAVIASLIIHTLLIFGFTFKAANPALFQSDKPLEVVLVNARSDSKPLKADVLAQNNLDGGGNVDEDRQAKSPLPASEEESPASSASLDQQIKAQEEKVRHLMSQVKSTYAVATEKPDTAPQPKPQASVPTPLDLSTDSLEMARLQARIDQEYEAYQKRPRRVFVGARAQEYSYARYVEDWRIKVERIGNMNYPEAAKRGHIHGALVLTVNIKSDGTLEDVQIDKSSGNKILDAAAVKIVQMSAPFAPFPAEMRKTVDVLGVTRVWNFTNDLQTSQTKQ
jgi:protein TonB